MNVGGALKSYVNKKNWFVGRECMILKHFHFVVPSKKEMVIDIHITQYTPAVPQKAFTSADCDSVYIIHYVSIPLYTIS